MMSKIDFWSLPEYKEWARSSGGGREAEEQSVESLLVRVESDGNEQDQFDALVHALGVYAKYADRDRVLEILQKLNVLRSDCLAGADFQIADILLHRFRDVPLALEYIRKGWETIDEISEDERLFVRLRLQHLEFFISSLEDPYSESIARFIEGAATFTEARVLYDESLVGALRFLVASGCVNQDVLVVIEGVWSDLARRVKFQAQGYQDDLNEIERLWFEAKDKLAPS